MGSGATVFPCQRRSGAVICHDGLARSDEISMAWPCARASASARLRTSSVIRPSASARQPRNQAVSSTRASSLAACSTSAVRVASICSRSQAASARLLAAASFASAIRLRSQTDSSAMRPMSSRAMPATCNASNRRCVVPSTRASTAANAARVAAKPESAGRGNSPFMSECWSSLLRLHL